MSSEQISIRHHVIHAIALLLLAPLLIIVSSTGIASGQEGPGGPPGFGDPPPGPAGPPGPPPMERLLGKHADRLGLDPAIREQIHSITTASRAEGDAIRDRLHALHEEMRALLSQENPDEGKVMKQAERVGLLETEARQHRLRGMLRVRALLTPEQREELVRIHDEQESSRSASTPFRKMPATVSGSAPIRCAPSAGKPPASCR